MRICLNGKIINTSISESYKKIFTRQFHDFPSPYVSPFALTKFGPVFSKDIIIGSRTAKKESIIEFPALKEGSLWQRDFFAHYGATGHEEDLKIWLNGKLVYRPILGSDEGMVTLKIADLPNPFTSPFDLTKFGDIHKRLIIRPGFRGNFTSNQGVLSKKVIWITPRFVIEELMKNANELSQKLLEMKLPKETPFTAIRKVNSFKHLAKDSYDCFKKVLDHWNDVKSPIGIFLTEYASQLVSPWCNIIKKTPEELSSINLFEIFKSNSRIPSEGFKDAAHFTLSFTKPKSDSKPA